MKTSLPIDPLLPTLCDVYGKHSALVISASPGAGKTTRVPVALSSFTEKQIWVLEPRRIAAVSAAARIAEENGWVLGNEVGYQVRFDHKSSQQTKILFLTEALLLRKLLQDPELSQVGCVILDEFHERSIHVDIALAALKELQELARPDLKIVVMSATLNAKPLSDFLSQAPIVEVPGKIYPNEIRFDDKSQMMQAGFEFIDRMKRLVVRAVSENPKGDILCFLPGRGEIERLRRSLEETPSIKLAIHALHGQLSLPEQRAAILPSLDQRKIILSTNIAESSLTVEGVSIVVDSGLVRLQKQDPRTGFESLVLSRISKASATQRAGRAARLGPGVVYRAWISHEESSMQAFELPEISRVDLSETILLLASLGVTHPESFSWFEPPSPRTLQMATEFLETLGAVGKGGALTELGRKLQEFPIHPRLAKLLIVGKEKGVASFAAELAAVLAEGRSVRGDHAATVENDVISIYHSWKNQRHQPQFKMLTRAVDQLKELAGAKGDGVVPDDLIVQELLLSIYGDRLCRRRGVRQVEAKMVGGRGVQLHPTSSVKESEFFLATEVTEGRDAAHATVFQAVGLSVDCIEKYILPESRAAVILQWDEEKQKFMAVETRQWHGLSVGAERRRPATASEISERLVEVAVERWSDILKNNEALQNWWERLHFLSFQRPEFPMLTLEAIKEGLSQACYGEVSLSALERKDLVAYFENLLDDKQRSALQKECPSHWVVPTGNRYRIRYTQEQGPQMEVRLQELFGLAQTPIICGQPLTLFLLAPNYRPVQVTRDLKSFWQNGYLDVRKEMRARYPKHSWPEDPLTAPPQSKGRPRQD